MNIKARACAREAAAASRASPLCILHHSALLLMRSAHLGPSRPQAKTHEKVDSLGEERSIACHTVVLLIKK